MSITVIRIEQLRVLRWTSTYHRMVYVPRWGRRFPRLWAVYDALSAKRRGLRERCFMQSQYLVGRFDAAAGGESGTPITD